MGMFTSCYDEYGNEHQIKCGHDNCDSFHLGEYVKSYVIEGYYGEGYLLDGVYEEWTNSIIIIKKCRLHTIIQSDKVTGNEFVEYEIRDPSKYHWSLEVFEQYQKKQEEIRLEREEYARKIVNVPSEKRLAFAMIGPLMRRRDYSSIARTLFTERPIEQLDEKTLQLQLEKQKLEEQQKLINKYDVIRIVTEFNLQGKSPDEIEKFICEALFGIIPAGFLVYAYPEKDDIDVVLSMYLGSGHVLFQCPVSQLIKGVDAVYQIYDS